MLATSMYCRTQIGICYENQGYQWCELKGPQGVTASLPSPDLQQHLC
jgi:hypothetical protein